jgi:hypothetical protein
VSLDPTRPVSPEPFDPARPASFPTQPVVPAPIVKPIAKPRSSTRALNAVLAIATVVAIGGVSFAVGRTTAPVAATGGRANFGGGNFAGGPNASFAPGASGAPGTFQGRGGFGLGGAVTVSGTVQSVTSDSLTLTTASGQTVTFALTGDTGYHSQTAASAADVAAGAKVEVQLDFATGAGRPTASADPSTPLGTASIVTVVP